MSSTRNPDFFKFATLKCQIILINILQIYTKGTAVSAKFKYFFVTDCMVLQGALLFHSIANSLFTVLGFVIHNNQDPFYWHGLTSISAWVSNHMSNKLWDEVTYPFPNFNSCTVEVLEWIDNFIPHIKTYLMTYLCRHWSWSMLVKWAPGSLKNISSGEAHYPLTDWAKLKWPPSCRPYFQIDFSGCNLL